MGCIEGGGDGANGVDRGRWEDVREQLRKASLRLFRAQRSHDLLGCCHIAKHGPELFLPSFIEPRRGFALVDFA